MRRTWLAAGVFVLSTLTASLALWEGGHSFDSRAASQGSPALIPGKAYVADVERDCADVDLEFQPNTRYVVVISSLAQSNGTFSVAASSREIAAPKFCPRPLPSRQPAAVIAGPHSSDSSIANSGTVESHARAKANSASSATSARTFALHVTDGSLDDPTQYAKVAAHQVAIGRNVRIYLDDQQLPKDLAPGLVGSIADLFDNELIPRFASVFGTYRDVDGDGRFSVLLSPWLSRLQGGRTSIGGFVRGSDFESHLAPPFSNHCDMMYVNSQTIPGPHLRTLLIHEYTHAVSFSRRTGNREGHTAFPEEEDWLNEALAHCAETLFGGGWSNLDYRISRYLNDTAAYPLVVEDYYRAGLWRCHGCRGATYLFLRYCVERFGAHTLTRLLGAPSRGTSNLELATGCSFERLFRDWTLSLIQNSPAPHAPTCQLASLDLYGPLGRWGLAGPRLRSWDVDSGALTVELKGTSTAFIEVSASQKPHLRRMHFSGARGTQLQLSLVRLSDDSPQIDVEANWSQRSSVAPKMAGATPSSSPAGNVLQMTVRAKSGQDLTVQQIAAEQNAGEDRAPLCFRGDSIKSIEVSARPEGVKTKSTAPIPSKPACRVFELPAQEFSDPTCPIVVKVVAVDGRGRRAVGWTTVRERSPQQVAALAASRH